jgi:hypothetical protein
MFLKRWQPFRPITVQKGKFRPNVGKGDSQSSSPILDRARNK